MRNKKRALTLLEVIIAILILFMANCCIFEILRTSYRCMTRIKVMGRLQTLTSSKLESIIYYNTYAPDPVGIWIPFPADNEYVYQVNASTMDLSACFPNYKAAHVVIDAKGPLGNPSVPEHHFSLRTILLDIYQPVITTEDMLWGELPSPEVYRH